MGLERGSGGSLPIASEGRAATRTGRRALGLAPEMMLEVVEAGWGHDTSMFRQMFAAQFMPEGTTEQWDAFDAHQVLTASPENALRLLTVSAGIEVTEVAPQVLTPTLVLHALDDRRVPFEQGELLASLIPGAQLVPLQSSNHILLDAEPAWKEFLAAIDAFVA